MSADISLRQNNDDKDVNSIQYVTIMIDGQMFGLPIGRVHDVFMPDTMTVVPMSGSSIAGVLNLRGRIVTAIDMRTMLHLPPLDEERKPMAVGIESKGESYGLIIDKVGEVLSLSEMKREPNPANLDKRWISISSGVFRLEKCLMVILDVDKILEQLVAGKSNEAA